MPKRSNQNTPHPLSVGKNSGSEAPKGRHKQVIEAILGGIASGRLKAGDRLPTEAELAKTFDASRATVARAMSELKDRGFLDRRRGGGTSVAFVGTTRQSGSRLALFAPFASPGPNLGYIGGQIYTHLSALASKRSDDLCLQVIDLSRGDQLEQMLAAVDDLRSRGVNGVFYYPLELPQEKAHYNQLVVDKIKSAGLAVVLVDRDIVTFPKRSDLSLVAYDNRRGGYLLADHLIHRGCRRIVFMGIPQSSSAVADRMRGYADALEDRGLHFDRSLIRRANQSELTEDFCRAMMQECRPDGIICKMDEFAAIVGRHLVDLGYKIGAEVKLAGFDDQPIAELLPVSLTTIRFPAEPFAQVCYERMVRQLADPTAGDAGLTLMNVELIIRASSGVDSHMPGRAARHEIEPVATV